MWGHILTEASTRQNFNFGFSSYKSEILVHLSQWQYWWWFWFGIWWALYYFIILKIINKKTFNFNVTLNTSVRGRGKWGDFLVALIPVSWCCNILINSNFILRMIEWQNESSLFTIRIQGKQWYWVYKYDPSTFQNIITSPKNIGHDKWRVNTGLDSINADTYYQALNLTAQLEFQQSYTSFLKKNETTKAYLENDFLNSEPIVYASQFINLKDTKMVLHLDINTDNGLVTSNPISHLEYLKDINFSQLKNTLDLFNILNTEQKDYSLLFTQNNSISGLESNLYDVRTVNLNITRSYLNTNKLKSDYYNYYYDNSLLDDTGDIDSNLRDYLSTQPFRVIKGTLNTQNLMNLKSTTNLQKLVLFNCLFLGDGSGMSDKDFHTENFWGFRQKKYKRLKKFAFKQQVTYDPQTFKVIGVKNIPNHTFIDIAGVDLLSTIKQNQDTHVNLSKPITVMQTNKDNSITTNYKTTNYRTAVRLNRKRSELVPVTLARRLLRTKRTLVIPAHINLTVITNSYDVVHSWFIPGLGLKLDCVPGRSTHHTFYVDNVGFYYGQCAEICGRYHHHMPIRLCALPFEQFVVWWNSKGLARLHRFAEIQKGNSNFKNMFTKKMIINKSY